MKRQRTTADFLWPALFLCASVVAWQLVVPSRLASYLIPRPTNIAAALYRNRGTLLHNTGVTMIEAIAGFAMANTVAFLLAVWSAYSRTAERIVYPYAIALKTAPIVALAPVLVVWLGTGKLSKMVASALICFFPTLINGIRGLRRVDYNAVNLFRSLGANHSTIFLKLRLPNALPYVFSALKISSSLSIVGAIVGEFVGAQEGLGYLITVSSYHFEVAEMFAAVLCASLGGITLFAIIAAVESILVPWGELDDDPVKH